MALLKAKRYACNAWCHSHDRTFYWNRMIGIIIYQNVRVRWLNWIAYVVIKLNQILLETLVLLLADMQYKPAGDQDKHGGDFFFYVKMQSPQLALRNSCIFVGYFSIYWESWRHIRNFSSPLIRETLLTMTGTRFALYRKPGIFGKANHSQDCIASDCPLMWSGLITT